MSCNYSSISRYILSYLLSYPWPWYSTLSQYFLQLVIDFFMLHVGPHADCMNSQTRTGNWFAGIFTHEKRQNP